MFHGKKIRQTKGLADFYDVKCLMAAVSPFQVNSENTVECI